MLDLIYHTIMMKIRPMDFGTHIYVITFKDKHILHASYLYEHR